jgi:hypothetical protein
VTDYVKAAFPSGDAVFLSLDRPSKINGKSTDNLEITVAYSGEKLAEAKQIIEDYIAETFPAKKAKSVVRPFKEKDGKTVLRFVSKATTKEGNPRTIPLSDSKGKEITRSLPIGRGSRVKIKASLAPSEYQGKDYVKLWLNSVQILKLVEYTGGDTWSADDEGDFDADAYGEANSGNTETRSAPSGNPEDADF